MVFSVNQVRQLYVVKEKLADVTTKVTDTSEAGSVYCGKTASGELYIQHIGKGGITRSDLIPVTQIMSATVATPKEMEYTRKAKLFKLKNTPVLGQDYILRVNILKYIGLSEDNQYEKFGAVHVNSAMVADAGAFYKAMAVSLFQNFSREDVKMIEFAVDDKVITDVRRNAQGDYVVYSDDTVISNFSNGIVIQEAVQSWELGIKTQEGVDFELSIAPIIYNADDVYDWAVFTNIDAVEHGNDKKVIGNGHTIADLEYFCMGFRGDTYRLMGYPNYVKTDYLVDPSKTYYVLNIHYYFVDDNQAVQKSEKDITIVCSDESSIKVIATFLKENGVKVTGKGDKAFVEYPIVQALPA